MKRRGLFIEYRCNFNLIKMHPLSLRQLLMMITFFNLPHIYLDGNQYEEIHID